MITDDRKAALLDALPDDFSRKMVEGAARIAGDAENAMRAHFFAAGWRVLNTHVLAKRAPHEEVRACPWFEQEAGTNRVTRRQRAIYATQGGFTDQYLADIGVDVSDHHDEAVAAIEALNDAVHVQDGQEIEGDEAITEFVEQAVSALEGLLEAFAMCRDAVADEIRDQVYENMMPAFVGETIGELDILCSHGYEVQPYITIDEIQIEDISATSLTVKVSGEAPVTLHYGKGEDAAEIGHEFPFVLTFIAPVEAPGDLTLESHTIDNSVWFGEDEEVGDDAAV